MIRPLLLVIVTSTAFLLLYMSMGYEVAYGIGYGAFSLMAAMISLTFLWLWFRRATPLAVGMALGWAGAASVMGWWWLFNLLGAPSAMKQSPILFLCLSLYFTGALMHFAVIQRSFGLPQSSFLLPVGASVLLSAALRLLL